MGANARLSVREVAVRPGAELVMELQVTNSAPVVDTFSLEVVGPAAPWSRCEPPQLAVMPGATQVARVVARPPLSPSVPAGAVPFGVHVRPREDPSGSTVAEALLHIEPVVAVESDLTPRTVRARGRRRARQDLLIRNLGNVATPVEVVGADDLDAVEVEADPAHVDLAPGTAQLIRVRPRGHLRFWTGPARSAPFRVETAAPATAAISSPAMLLHEAVIPRWLPRAVAAVVALAVLAVAAWFSVLKPVVADTATSATNTALTAAGIPTAPTGGSGGGSPGGGGGSSPTGTPSPGGPSPTPTPVQPVATGTSAPFALVLSTSTPSLSPVPGHGIDITDVVFENPDQDYGSVSVARGGVTYVRLDLQDFRDYDLHFITPIALPAGSTLTFAVDCQNTVSESVKPAPPHAGKPCTTSALVTGVSVRST